MDEKPSRVEKRCCGRVAMGGSCFSWRSEGSVGSWGMRLLNWSPASCADLVGNGRST